MVLDSDGPSTNQFIVVFDFLKSIKTQSGFHEGLKISDRDFGGAAVFFIKGHPSYKRGRPSYMRGGPFYKKRCPSHKRSRPSYMRGCSFSENCSIFMNGAALHI